MKIEKNIPPIHFQCQKKNSVSFGALPALWMTFANLLK